MNSAIAFFVGCLTFVLMMVIKIPIKKLIWALVERTDYDEDRQYVLYKRLNTVLLLVVMLVAAVCYFCVGTMLEIDHFKWCCSLKAGAIAIALFGDNWEEKEAYRAVIKVAEEA